MGPSYFQTAFHDLQSNILPNIHPIGSPSVHQDDPNSQDRVCSVRGCSAPLSPDYNHKMCETCRGRHRIYAITKRAKRKAEKAAAVGGLADDSDDLVQISSTSEYNGSSDKDPTASVWPPSGSSVSTGNQLPKTPADNSTSSLVQEPSGSTTSINGYALPDSWDHSHNNIDPRLFQSSSELAGALTYGSLTSAGKGVESLATESIGPSSPLSLSYNSRSRSPPQPPPSHDPHTSSSAASSRSTPRYCSIKGCKAVLSGDTFFKMCDACRIRYRGYGITKRAKWRREREEGHNESDHLEDNMDDSAQASDPDCSTWQDASNFQICTGEGNLPKASTSFPAKMCTVSHCRQVLPVYYEYRRCEQHRMQNRHHSKLKREREKDIKAQAKNSWAEDAGDELECIPATPKEKERAMEPLFTTTPMDLKNRDKRNAENRGAPPGRAIRRTNHVCSAKLCHNLLNPMVPWKMCESCRERDRTTRKNRAIRNANASVKSQSPVISITVGSALLHSVEKSTSTFQDLEPTSAPPTTEPLLVSASKTPPDIDKAEHVSRPPSTPTSTNDQLATPVSAGSPNLIFDDIMLHELPDSISTDINAVRHESTSIETFTSVFQANVPPASKQPKPVRFAKSSSVSSTPVSKGPDEPIDAIPVHVSPHPDLILESPVTGAPSDLDSRQTSDINSNRKQKPRKKRSLNKINDIAGAVVDVTTVADSPPSSQDNSQMPTTVSPQSVEIIPTQYPNPRHDTHTPSSVTFSQYSAAPYSSTFAPPLPYYMPPPFNPYGPQQTHYPYPPAYPYGRSTYYTQQHPPLLPPYTSGPYRIPPYPYQYPYAHAPFPNPSGLTAPSYSSVSYPQLQWSTNMTPQAPPPEYAAESNSSVSNAVLIESDEETHKRKRDDLESSNLGQPEGSVVRKPVSEKEIIDITASPLLEHAIDATQLVDNPELHPALKKQTFVCSKKSCSRPVRSKNSLCERCIGRLKRRRIKTKERFRLKPKMPVGKRLEEGSVQGSALPI